ncbi:hypothetical protein [uncultured Endozoicomonas sp.]|uniref:hypothetical protein n=1 Tax=uncultured Endozoicomonas sp. TaxID=432652 RepID=UPI00261C01D1|nr:hypothetical protein [uncultured Endozoicomonas sp.]
MTEPHTSTAVAGGAVATGISLKNSAVARSFSDATWTQVMDGSFELYMSDILAVVGVVGLVFNIWLGFRRDRRQEKQDHDK